MTSKIDFLGIIEGHCSTLRAVGSKKILWTDVFLFYGFPVIASAGLVYLTNRSLTPSAVDFLATIFSIFVGLLLNLLVLIIGIAPHKLDATSDEMTRRRCTLLHETFANISYAILISVLLIIFLFVSKLAEGEWLKFCGFVCFAIVGNFLLTLLMVLKRVHSVLTHDLKK